MTQGLRLLKAKLQGFKTFNGRHEITFDRPPGLYYIRGINRFRPGLGPNAVGKTTLIDAVYWCWTGRTIRDPKPASAVEGWRHTGRTSVATDVFRLGQVYRIIRSRNPNALRMTWPGKGLVEVEQEEVDRLIGLSAEALRRTMIVGQFGTLFLDLKPEQQSNLFTEILDLDVWLKASSYAGDQSKAVQKEVQTTAEDLAREDGRVQELRTQWQQAIDDRTTWESDQSGKVKIAEKALELAKADLERVRKVPKGGLGSPGKGSGTREGAIRSRDRGEGELASLRSQERELIPQVERLNQNIQTSSNLVSTLTEHAERYKSTEDNRCPECGQKVSRNHLDQKLVEKTKELRAARQVHAQLRDQSGAALKELRDVQSKIEDKEAEVAKLRKAADQAGEQLELFDQKIKNAERHLLNCETDFTFLKVAANPHRARANNLKRSLQRAKEQFEWMKEAKDKLEKLSGAYSYWMTSFKQIRLALIDEALAELEAATNDHADFLGLKEWSIQFATERETKSGSVSRGFNTLIVPSGQKKPITWESYSGGESQRLQLATAFGLSEVLLTRAGLAPNVEFLDEPTQHLSPEGIDDLLVHLRERARELKRAIYLIDHRALDQGAFDGTITIERTREGSRIIEQ